MGEWFLYAFAAALGWYAGRLVIECIEQRINRLIRRFGWWL